MIEGEKVTFLIKNPIVIFFRDVISGGWYFLYILLCGFIMLAIFGVIGDRKRRAIEEKLKEKKKWSIESGEEARIAALESKQVLDIMEDVKPAAPSVTEENDLKKEEEVPSVLVIGADGSSNIDENKTSV